MFAASFGLSENPFKITPNLRFVYLGENFRKVRSEAARALASRNGAVLLTARAGVGKSILLRLLAQDLDGTDASGLTLSLACSPGATVEQLVGQALATLDAGSRETGPREAEPGESGPGESGTKLPEDHLQRLVAECIAGGHACVLLIDEAQNLSDHELGRLFLLTDQVDHRGGRLRIALAGPPELEGRLEQALPNDFRRRILLRRRLEPLAEREVATFIAERLEAVGSSRHDIFSADAITRITYYANGVPRLVNNLCQTALFLAEFESRDSVTAELVDEAARQVGVAPPEASGRAVVPVPRRRPPAAPAPSPAGGEKTPLPARLERFEARVPQRAERDHIVLQPELAPEAQAPRSKDTRTRSWPGLLFGASATAAVLVTLFVLLEKPEFLSGVTDRPSDPQGAELGTSPPATTPDVPAAGPDAGPDADPGADLGAALATDAPDADAADQDPAPAEALDLTTVAPSPSVDTEENAPPPAPPVDPAALAELGAARDDAATPDMAPTTVAPPSNEAAPADEPNAPADAATESSPEVPADARRPGADEAVAAAETAPAAVAPPESSPDDASTASPPPPASSASAEEDAGEEDAGPAESRAAKADGGVAGPGAGTAASDSEAGSFVAPEPEAGPADVATASLPPTAEKEVSDAAPARPEPPADVSPTARAIERETAAEEETAASETPAAAATAETQDAPASPPTPAKPNAGTPETEVASGEQQAPPVSGADLPAAPARTAVVENLLEHARQQIAALKLTTPEGDNAFETYQRVLALAPGHEAALQGFRNVADKYIQLAETAERRGQSDRAQGYYEKAAAIAPDHPALAALSRQRAEAAAQAQAVEAPAEPTSAPPAAQQAVAAAGAGTAATPNPSPAASPEEALNQLLARVFNDDAAVPAQPSQEQPAAPAPEAAPGAEGDGAAVGSAPTLFPMPPGALESPQRLRAALAAGADANTRFADGRTPLIVAAAQRRNEMVAMLLARGAEPNAATQALGTPLMYAVWNGDLASVETLLQGGAKVDLKNIDGKTALMAAAANGHAALVDMLLRHGADVNARTINGWTALMYAVWGRHAAVVAQLLERGADVSVVNEDGDSAASIAAERGHFEIANMLRSQQARNQ